MRAARQAAAELREPLAQAGFPLLCQGEDSTSLLVTKFAADEPTCLFGTISLWQGVDVPGRSLQLVVIDRIPFPRPDDPLASARQRTVAARGGNGFMTVAAAQAALLLAQGAGRLLRTMSDKGVVAVLDPRLATARYGSFLRASLPPFWATSDPEVVRGALRRLAGPPPPGSPPAPGDSDRERTARCSTSRPTATSTSTADILEHCAPGMVVTGAAAAAPRNVCSSRRVSHPSRHRGTGAPARRAGNSPLRPYSS